MVRSRKLPPAIARRRAIFDANATGAEIGAGHIRWPATRTPSDASPSYCSARLTVNVCSVSVSVTD